MKKTKRELEEELQELLKKREELKKPPLQGYWSTCPICYGGLSHIFGMGYVCPRCLGIED